MCPLDRSLRDGRPLFLHFRVTNQGLALARQTVERCRERVSRLYEHDAGAGRFVCDLHRWARWVRAGMREIVVELESGAQCVVAVVMARLISRCNSIGPALSPCSGI